MAAKDHGQGVGGGSGVETASLAFVVADDHPMVRDALAAALKGAFPDAKIGFAGTLSETQSAIDAAPETDLVVLDLDMPGMLGLAGLSALRAQHPSLPIAIVSATTNSAAMRQAIEMGAAGFIPKLAAADRFLDAVRMILAGAVALPDEARGMACAAAWVLRCGRRTAKRRGRDPDATLTNHQLF